MNWFNTFKIEKVILFILPLAILLTYYISYYPGCYSEDSIAYFQNFNDHHPLFFLIYLRLIKFISGSYQGYIFLNIILFSLLYSRALILFVKLGLSFPLILVLAIVVPLLPVTGYMLIAYWKDILYAISFCYLSLLLIELVINRRNNQELSKHFFFELFIAFLFLIGTRHNGIITSLFTLAPLLWYLNIYRKHLFSSFFWAFVFVSTIGFSAKKFWGAETGWMSIDHLFVRHLSVYLHESKLDSAGIILLSDIMPLKGFEDGFNYYSHDGYAYGPYSEKYRKNVQKYKWRVRKSFCINLIKSPLVFLKSELLMSQLIWRPIPINGSFRNTYCSDVRSDNKNAVRSIFDYLLKQSDRIDKPFYTRIFFWSGSFQVWAIILISIASFKLFGRFTLMPFLPIAGNLLSLFVALVSQEFRYLYGEVLVFPFLFLYFIYLLVSSSKKV